jgi:geranylgeranyl diphosphate synthase type I
MDAESRGRIEACMQWVEEEMAAVLAARPAGVALYGMQRYHLGWVSAEFEPLPPEAARRFGGKKLRGVLCLLAAEAVGGPPRAAVPAAAAVEFIHNFSLIHDDLEDEDPERRHRPTVWRLWGVPQAVNAGSNMQALVNEAALRLTRRGVSADRTLGVIDTLTRAKLAMTEGQALDLSWQDRWDLGVDDYLRMAAGKTAALTEAAAWCGAAVAAPDEQTLGEIARFGHAFGMAFQARDDYLGIWGCSEQTGKPVGADIQQGKRSLPIVHALEKVAAGGEKAATARELCPALERREVERVLAALEATGSQSFTEQTAARYTTAALAHLDAIAAQCSGADAGTRVLRRIAADALGRDE